MLAAPVVVFELRHRSRKLGRVRRGVHVLVTYERGQFDVRIGRLGAVRRRWLLAERRSQGRGNLFQRVVPEVAFGREIGEAICQHQLMRRRRQLADCERQVLGYLSPLLVRHLAKPVQLLHDRLLLLAPNDLLPLREQSSGTKQACREHWNSGYKKNGCGYCQLNGHHPAHISYPPLSGCAAPSCGKALPFHVVAAVP
ncbi:hypothetical protein SBA2_450113 [Acidobacteriia bacterium SbA2]|nr:hypothetical protein SBA2_450113 [Acidobacteriia bacterium SbA2]